MPTELPFRVTGTDLLDLEVIVREGAVAQGRLLGVSDAEIAGATVQGRRQGGWAEGVVNRDGSYRVTGLAAGEWTLTATTVADRREARAL